MNDASRPPLVYKPLHKVRFVTAASLFDGHDASINIMRRILQATGCEVIHLGHNRSVEEIVNCALQEDAHGIAISSYQGGHVEFFKYMLDLLRERGGGHVKVFGGGGGVIVPDEIRELHEYGVARIFSPEDGQKLGLQGMISEIVAACDVDLARDLPASLDALRRGSRFERTHALARLVTGLENDAVPAKLREELHAAAKKTAVPTLGITGTGGAGKSSLTDELVRRFRLDQGDALKIAIVSIDPSRRKSGGALLGDRIRMNAIEHPNIYMRSLATRDSVTRQRDLEGAARRDRRVQGRGLRPRDGRDVGDRPGRRGDRAAGRRVAVRDDAGVRRGEPAGEDRHARLRRLRRDQQVRPQGRAGRAARRAQAVPAQPRGVEDTARGNARVRHDGLALQRRRRDRALPGAGAGTGREGPEARAGPPAAGRVAALDRAERDRAAGAGALPGRDRRDRPWLSRLDAGAGDARARAAAVARGEADARGDPRLDPCARHPHPNPLPLRGRGRRSACAHRPIRAAPGQGCRAIANRFGLHFPLPPRGRGSG